MAMTSAKQRIEAFQNWNVWETKQSLSSKSISAFGVRGHKFVLIKATDSFFERIWASVLKALNVIKTHQNATTALYRKTLYLLQDSETLRLVQSIPSSKDGSASAPHFVDGKASAQAIVEINNQKTKLETEIQNLHQVKAQEASGFNAQVVQIRADLENAILDKNRTQQDWAQEKADLTRQLSNKQAESASLGLRFEELQGDLNAHIHSRRDLIAGQRALAAKAATLETEKEKLQSDLTDITHKSSHFESEVGRLEQGYGNLKDSFAKQSVEHEAQVKSWQNQKTLLEKNIQDLHHEIHQLRHKEHQLKQALGQKEQEIGTLNAHAKELLDYLRTSKHENDDYKTKLNKLVSEIENLNAEKALHHAKNKDHSEKHQTLTLKIAELEDKFKQETGLKADLEKERGELKETLGKKVQELNSEVEKLKRNLRDKEGHLAQVVEENEQLQDEIATTKEKTKSQEKLLQSNHELLEELSHTFENTEREKDQFRTQSLELAKEKAFLAKREQELKDELMEAALKWKEQQVKSENEVKTAASDEKIAQEKPAAAAAPVTTPAELAVVVDQQFEELKKQLEYWQKSHGDAMMELTQLRNVKSDAFKRFFINAVESGEGLKELTTKRNTRNESPLEKLLKEYKKRNPDDFDKMISAVRYSNLGNSGRTGF